MIVLRKIGGKLNPLWQNSGGPLFSLGSRGAPSFFGMSMLTLILFTAALVMVLWTMLHGGFHLAQIGAIPLGAIGATAPAAPKLLPFRMGTRQRRAKVGTIVYAAASAGQPLPLPRVGLASRIVAQFRGVVTLSGAGALSDQGPWNLLSRIRVNTNIGAASLIDVSGYGGYLMQKWIEQGYLPDNGGAGSVTPNANIHAAPVAMGANTWVLTWVLPISANSGINFETGLINLQAPEISVTVEPIFGALLDPATLVTATTGNLHVYYEYYEIPDPRRFSLPGLTLVRCIEEQQAVGQVGDNIYTVPRMGTLLQLIHRLTFNAARSDGWDSSSIKFNKTDTVYNDEMQVMKVFERVHYGTPPISGTIFRDFWSAFAEVSRGDTRDAIDSEQLTTLESIITVSAGTTLGANNNFLASIRRIMQMIG